MDLLLAQDLGVVFQSSEVVSNLLTFAAQGLTFLSRLSRNCQGQREADRYTRQSGLWVEGGSGRLGWVELLQLAFSRIFLLLRFQEASEGTSVLGSAESDQVFLFKGPGFFCSRKFDFWVMFHQYSCQRLLR